MTILSFGASTFFDEDQLSDSSCFLIRENCHLRDRMTTTGFRGTLFDTHGTTPDHRRQQKARPHVPRLSRPCWIFNRARTDGEAHPRSARRARILPSGASRGNRRVLFQR